MTKRAFVVAGIAGFLAVAAGTFGAHVLKERLAPDLLEIFEVGVRYHAYHALALLGCACAAERIGRAAGVATWAFAIGIIIFAGSLYTLALTDLRWLGAITPIGGVAFLVGWTAIAIGGLRR